MAIPLGYVLRTTMRASMPNSNWSSRLGYNSGARRVVCGNCAGDAAK